MGRGLDVKNPKKIREGSMTDDAGSCSMRQSTATVFPMTCLFRLVCESPVSEEDVKLIASTSCSKRTKQAELDHGETIRLGNGRRLIWRLSKVVGENQEVAERNSLLQIDVAVCVAR